LLVEKRRVFAVMRRNLRVRRRGVVVRPEVHLHHFVEVSVNDIIIKTCALRKPHPNQHPVRMCITKPRRLRFFLNNLPTFRRK